MYGNPQKLYILGGYTHGKRMIFGGYHLPDIRKMITISVRSTEWS